MRKTTTVALLGLLLHLAVPEVLGQAKATAPIRAIATALRGIGVVKEAGAYGGKSMGTMAYQYLTGLPALFSNATIPVVVAVKHHLDSPVSDAPSAKHFVCTKHCFIYDLVLNEDPLTILYSNGSIFRNMKRVTEGRWGVMPKVSINIFVIPQWKGLCYNPRWKCFVRLRPYIYAISLIHNFIHINSVLYLFNYSYTGTHVDKFVMKCMDALCGTKHVDIRRKNEYQFASLPVYRHFDAISSKHKSGFGLFDLPSYKPEEYNVTSKNQTRYNSLRTRQQGAKPFFWPPIILIGLAIAWAFIEVVERTCLNNEGDK